MIGIKEYEPITIGDFTINGIAAAHNEVERDANGNPHFMGFVISFGNWNIYHSGDTLWHPELTSDLTKFAIDVAIVPINGNNPERKVAGNLNGTEAGAFQNIRPRSPYLITLTCLNLIQKHLKSSPRSVKD